MAVDPTLLMLLLRVGGPALLQAGKSLVNDRGYDPNLMKDQFNQNDLLDIDNMMQGTQYEAEAANNPKKSWYTKPTGNDLHGGSVSQNDLAEFGYAAGNFFPGDKPLDQSPAMSSAIAMAMNNGPAVDDDVWEETLKKRRLLDEFYGGR